MKHIVIAGGGFGGLYTAYHLEKRFRHNQGEMLLSLISHENYFTFQPMLSEVVGGILGPLDSITPLRDMLKTTAIYRQEILAINLEDQELTLSNFHGEPHTLNYDHLVLGLGAVTDFRTTPSLQAHALPFRTLSDSMAIRSQVIDCVEAAAVEKDPARRKALLTFVVGGGDFHGVEVVAEINDLARHVAAKTPGLSANDPHVVLASPSSALYEGQLDPQLGEKAYLLLKKRGVDIRLSQSLIEATACSATLDGGESLSTMTTLSSLPLLPNPLIEGLPLEKEGGRLLAEATLNIKGQDSLWAIGDCASIPNLIQGGECPPTAQFAIRQAKTLAHNIWAACKSEATLPFRFRCLGLMGSLGNHRAVGQIIGGIRLSGWIGWIMWRLIYWMKLPTIGRRIRVLKAWMIQAFLPIQTTSLHLHDRNPSPLSFPANLPLPRGKYYLLIRGSLSQPCPLFSPIETLSQPITTTSPALLLPLSADAYSACTFSKDKDKE
ncbi:MAG: FAD-dependent oxidoreductase [Chlamydiota bacterium]|nr:FAD-dependent oxidoreductase [Chlamydiota bacterium]